MTYKEAVIFANGLRDASRCNNNCSFLYKIFLDIAIECISKVEHQRNIENCVGECVCDDFSEVE